MAAGDVAGQRRAPGLRAGPKAARWPGRSRRASGFEVGVTPLIAVVGAADGFAIKEQPAGVVVCASRRIVDWLRSQPATLSSGTVEAIYSVNRLPSTRAAVGPEGASHRPNACPSSEETTASLTTELAQVAPGPRRAEDRSQLFRCARLPCSWRPEAGGGKICRSSLEPRSALLVPARTVVSERPILC